MMVNSSLVTVELALASFTMLYNAYRPTIVAKRVTMLSEQYKYVLVASYLFFAQPSQCFHHTVWSKAHECFLFSADATLILSAFLVLVSSVFVCLACLSTNICKAFVDLQPAVVFREWNENKG
jgi:hypothetical protein